MRGDRIEIPDSAAFAQLSPTRVGRNPKSGDKVNTGQWGFPLQGWKRAARAVDKDHLKRVLAQCVRFPAVAKATAFSMNALTWAAALYISPAVRFAVANTEPVAVRFVLGQVWHAPLVIVLLLFFSAGALGVLSMLTILYRQRREIARLKRAGRRRHHHFPRHEARFSITGNSC